jgi:hypothetical protein
VAAVSKRRDRKLMKPPQLVADVTVTAGGTKRFVVCQLSVT